MFTGTPEIDGFAFTACPLDRSDVLRDRPDDMAALWPAARLLVLDEAGDALCGEDGAPLPLTGADLGGGGPGTAIFLGVEPGGTAWFCVDAVTVNAAAPGRTGLRQAGAVWPAAGSLEKRRCPPSRVRQQRNKPRSAILRTVLLLTPSSVAICPVE